MALVLDTGPILAALDPSDAHHRRCRDLIEGSVERLVIPAPVLVELDYLIHARMHQGVMNAVVEDISNGAYEVADVEVPDYARIVELCSQYLDSDIGFVDAAILAIVERLNEPKLATLDHRHFGMMRPRHVDHLELLPA